MRNRFFNVTYEFFTPESVAHSDAAERGYLFADGSRQDMEGIIGERAARTKDDAAMDLKQAWRMLADCLEDCGNGRDFREADERQNYKTGESEIRTLHCPDTITAASFARLARIVAHPCAK